MDVPQSDAEQGLCTNSDIALILLVGMTGSEPATPTSRTLQLGSYLTRTDDPLELSLQLSETPMSAVGSKSNYGFPDAVARDLLMSWEN